jgi:GT2 family glycosyltransferase
VTIDISVVFATRNRASALEETLEAMSRLDNDGRSIEFVVVDNGSTDDTARLLERYKERLPLRVLWEPVAGKNRALNVALEAAPLGDIVAFTDDDVTPGEGWLRDISAACRRWPQHSVFGGRVDPVLPDGHEMPSWAQHHVIQEFAFAQHWISAVEAEYPPRKEPFGPNYWVRRSAIGRTRFEPMLGPHPTRRRLGGETQFLRDLRRRGHTPVFVPAIKVGHRIEVERVTRRAVYWRAWQLGKGKVYAEGLPATQRLLESLPDWRRERLRDLLLDGIGLLIGAVLSNPRERVVNMALHLSQLSKTVEALELSLPMNRTLLEHVLESPETLTDDIPQEPGAAHRADPPSLSNAHSA